MVLSSKLFLLLVLLLHLLTQIIYSQLITIASKYLLYSVIEGCSLTGGYKGSFHQFVSGVLSLT